jgi:3-hydroxyisobutyrate dehydrogenase
MTRVAILGLGLMGSEIARNLLSKGDDVHGFNRTSEKTNALVEKGLVAHSTPRETVEDVDVVITMLSDQDAVREVALGSNGFLDCMRPGSVWIDMSTILPEKSIEHANECKERGVERLDAPVVGGPERAFKGELVVIVGGRRDVFEKHAAFLGKLGKQIVYVGSFGSGHAMKLAFNLYLAVLATGFSEALTLAQKLGLSGRDFVDLVNKTHHKNSYTENKGPLVCKKDFTPTFTLEMMRKDLALIEEEKLIKRISLPVTASVLALFTAAMNEGFAKLDYSSIAAMLQKMNGIDA